MPVYCIDGVTPVVDRSAYVHPTAVLIGDVIVGPGCYIGPGASLRGDFGRIVVMQGANVQDTCVLHGFPRTETVVESDGHIGHGAVLHGCRIGINVMVGMNAVVMDDAQIGGDSIIAACAFVKAGFIAPPRSLIAGVPATVKRELTEDEIAWKGHGTRLYQQLARRSAANMREVEPLAEIEADRPRIEVEEYRPLYKVKRDAGRDR